jgi:hypothetical protein
VQKSGFCYTVTGTTSATIIINITNGVLNVYPQLGATSVSTDIPWYCYLASAVLGGVIGGVIGFFAGGIIGLAVGAALGAAAGAGGLAAAQSGITGVINSALSTVVNAINGDLPDIKQSLTGFNAVIQDVQVDDITFTNAIVPIESVPFKSGDLIIANNSYLDLDTVSTSSSLAGADLSWTGSGNSRVLTPIGSIAKLAETGVNDLSKITLYQLYQHSYKNDPVNIAHLGPAGSSAPVFGYRSDQFRYGCFQVTKTQDDSIQLRYKTYATYQGSSIVPALANLSAGRSGRCHCCRRRWRTRWESQSFPPAGPCCSCRSFWRSSAPVCCVDVLVLQGPEKSFNKDVVQGSPLSVHKNIDSFFTQLDVTLVGELAATVAVDNLQYGLSKRPTPGGQPASFYRFGSSTIFFNSRIMLFLSWL